MVVPDYQMLEYVERIASQLSDDPVCCFFSAEVYQTFLLIKSIVYSSILLTSENLFYPLQSFKQFYHFENSIYVINSIN